MADAAISFAVEKLGDALINKVGFLIGVEDQVRWLIDELKTMQCFLIDAGEKQGNKEYGHLISQWIRDVREVAQDAEDAIEIFAFMVDAPRERRNPVRRWACFLSHLSNLNSLGNKIGFIKTRLDEITKRRVTYDIRDLGELGMEPSRSRAEIADLRRRMATHNDKDIVGLNKDADLLLNEVILNGKKKGLSLVAIVGMGGIGKSTLAWKIHKQCRIANQFAEQTFVVVSNDFVAEDVMKLIIDGLSNPLSEEELRRLNSIESRVSRQEKLQRMLRKRLQGKRYFIILDDVWETIHWDALKNAFPDEQDKASRLLLTSRNQIISEHRGYVHKMQFLSRHESWELLLKTTLMGESRPQWLEDIGEEVLNKCHDLPLAITTVGGLLRNKRRSGWERVLEQIRNYDSETNEIAKSVSPILELSYQNLPSELKPCFLTLAFFKEDAIIRAKRLIHIWVAPGLVQEGEERAEEIGMHYLNELIDRNLILVKGMSMDDRVKYCYMHDLLHELSIKKAKEEIGFESLVIKNDEGSSSSKPTSLYMPRHRVVRSSGARTIWNDPSNRKHLRSLFLSVDNLSETHFYSSSYWKGFELLRILDIKGSMLWELPSAISALVGIRYLRLTDEETLILPSWLDALKNLEVIDIPYCRSVVMPNVTYWKLNSLRHFYIHHRCNLVGTEKIYSWTNLETLKYVSLKNFLCGNQIKVFSQHLRKLGIQLDNKKKEELLVRFLEESMVQVLHLIYSTEGFEEMLNLSSLEHLTKLKLYGSFKMYFSADKYPPNITHLTLSRSGHKHDDAMKELSKLTNLLYLKIDGVHFVRWTVSHGAFPKLNVLHLMRLSYSLGMYVEKGGMPELQRVEIYECPFFEIEILGNRIPSPEFITIHEA